MNVDETLKTPALRKAAVTFAAGYAKRKMEGQYTRLMNTKFEKERAAAAQRIAEQSQTRAITASGVGFKPNDVRSQAQERLIKRIQNEAKSLLADLALTSR